MANSSSPKRPSKFIEALPQFDESTSQAAITTPSDELFYSILHEMDDYETRQRERGGSQSSFDSLPSPATTSATRTPSFGIGNTVKEGRRSINFTRSSLDKELTANAGSGRERSGSGGRGEGSGSEGDNAGDKFARKFVGRLRALTGGKREDVKSVAYPGS